MDARNSPPDWYPDPQQPERDRYWDGSAWTDNIRARTLVDEMLKSGGFVRAKEQRLVVTTDGLSWGDEQVRWDDVTDFSQLITSQEYRGVILYEVHLQCSDRVVRVVFEPRSKRDAATRRAYDVILAQLKRTVGQRVLNGLIRMMDAGEPVRIGGLRLAPEGFMAEDKRGENVPWTEYAGVEVRRGNSVVIELFRAKPGGKRKQACRVKVNLLRGWILPPLIEEHARRYAPAPSGLTP